MQTENENLTIRKRSAILSALLSFITPGLGHLYNGKFRLAIIIPVVYLILSAVILITGLIKIFTFMMILVLLSITVYLYSIIHSIILARRNSSYQIKNYNKFIIYILWPVLFFGIGLIISESNTVRAFKVPSNSMKNTLIQGDIFLADMNYYKLNNVNRNDIVIFNDPRYPDRLTIKRAIAFGGETISIANGQIFIIGKLFEENNPDIIYETRNYIDLNEMTIPDNHIFFIGDNRPNSLDSRMFGPVSEKNVRGRPIYIYFSDSFDRIGKTLN